MIIYFMVKTIEWLDTRIRMMKLKINQIKIILLYVHVPMYIE